MFSLPFLVLPKTASRLHPQSQHFRGNFDIFPMHPQNLRQHLFRLFSWQNPIHKPMLHQKLCPLEPFRQFLSYCLLNNPRSRKPDQRMRLRQNNIPSIAQLAVTPPIVGSVSTLTYKSPASLCLFSAADVFAICIRETIPPASAPLPSTQTKSPAAKASSPSPPPA